jgi:UDP-N-acetylmuramoylalanine--D-glutamate ligase
MSDGVQRDDDHGVRALVIGFGRTGVAVARSLLAGGAAVRVCDRRPAADFATALSPLAGRVDARLGSEDLTCLDGITLVVPSPGVPADAPLLRAANRRGITVLSEIELAARALTVPLLAVTGTNGKSTTTSLLGEMLRAAGARPFVGGNLGTPLIEAVGGAYDVAVAEVSSFQLEWVERLRPRIGVFLNLTDDHLDRHADREVYGRTKLRLFARQTEDDVAVLNGADPWICGHAGDLRARRIWFGAGTGAANRPEVGNGSPSDPCAGSLSESHPRAGNFSESHSDAGDRVVLRTDGAAIHLRLAGRDEVYPLDAVQLAGAHNRENMMAAVAAARAFGVPAAAVQQALERFRGLEHRLELVRERAGVRYVNDSKGTNAGAVIKSLASFPGNVILLAGGIEKGGDYGVLVEPVRRAVKRAIVFGAARELLARTLASATEVELVDSLAEAVARAAAVAGRGDTVLLSPACASFDMFRDYADRGRQFKALVEAL